MLSQVMLEQPLFFCYRLLPILCPCFWSNLVFLSNHFESRLLLLMSCFQQTGASQSAEPLAKMTSRVFYFLLLSVLFIQLHSTTLILDAGFILSQPFPLQNCFANNVSCSLLPSVPIPTSWLKYEK